jgi:hypothetical protein
MSSQPPQGLAEQTPTERREDRAASWAQPATVVACTTGEVAALASVRLVCMIEDRRCGGGHYRRERASSLCSLGRRGMSQPL